MYGSAVLFNKPAVKNNKTDHFRQAYSPKTMRHIAGCGLVNGPEIRLNPLRLYKDFHIQAQGTCPSYSLARALCK